MKQQVLIWSVLILTLTSIDTKGQCKANAGNDTALCAIASDTFFLGGSPTATGGIGPYSYTWSCTYTILTLTFTASDFLDDTTSANPMLIYPGVNELTFYLTVTDSLGNVCDDSVTIRFSNWIMTLDDKIAFINKGDSVQLYKSLHGGIPPVSHLWSPSIGLTDPTNVFTWAKPDSTTTYSLLATDSIGCNGWDIFRVVVLPTGLYEKKGSQLKFDLYPNPMTDYSTLKIIDPISQGLGIEFFDVFGRSIKQLEILEKETRIYRRDFNTGLYFYQLFEKNKPVGKGKILIN